ncbi:MAG: ribonuclease E/G [Nitrospirae bacterium]|nr:ribonuclease E/G [Nitrospirota bacterium]
MSRKMLINAAHPEEIRVAIVDNGILEELNIETTSKERNKGNIYRAVVVRAEPSLQAAFVDYGGARHGFIPMGEIHPSFHAVTEEKRQRGVRIQDVIFRGTELLVQVEKEERNGKGAFLTTYISLPGRYLVLMPFAQKSGVSRKIEDEEQRDKLKKMLEELAPPAGMGYIIRTAGLGRTKAELSKDLSSLLRLWESIQEKSGELPAPCLVYQEADIVLQTIRDYFTTDTDEILVDNREVHKDVMDFLTVVMPRVRGKVHLCQEKRPLFSKYNLEEQIETIYEHKVPLPSGGSIVVDTTEALVAIDVNSGKSKGERGIEDTAFKTNLEAAEEIGRQLRLRDLGGLVMIDFIDMESHKHSREVEKAFKNAIKRDKAKIDMGRISKFGILEVSRQRLRPPVQEGAYVTCSQCAGEGVVRTAESQALAILRRIQAGVVKGNTGEVQGRLSSETANYLLNYKRESLMALERENDVRIILSSDPGLSPSQYHLEFVKRTQPPRAAVPSVPAVLEIGVEEKPAAPIVAALEPAEVSEKEETEGEGEGEEAAPAPSPAEEKKPRRRRRRRRRKKSSSAEAAAPSQAASEAETPGDGEDEGGGVPLVEEPVTPAAG